MSQMNNKEFLMQEEELLLIETCKEIHLDLQEYGICMKIYQD